MWAYLARYPGLVVLHDARLHHARARSLLNQQRFDDYRREFRYDHPDAPAGFAEYAVEGLGGIDLLLLVDAARRDAHGADSSPSTTRASPTTCASSIPGVAVDTIRMGVPETPGTASGRRALACGATSGSRTRRSCSRRSAR